MKLRINASTPVLRRYLEVDETSVLYCETAVMGGLTRIEYEDVVAVLRDHAKLSIQVGRNIYSLPYNAANREHTQALAMLIEGCRRSQA